MIDTYKKLPGNNCGECGETTCMAFALRVKSAKRKISECPYVKQEDEGSVGQESVVTMENNYKRVSRELEEEVKRVDLKEAAAAIGGDYENRDGGGVIKLKMMNPAQNNKFHSQDMKKALENAPEQTSLVNHKAY